MKFFYPANALPPNHVSYLHAILSINMHIVIYIIPCNQVHE